MFIPSSLTNQVAAPSEKRSGRNLAHHARATALRFVKAPFLGRYVVDWRWPQSVERGAWQALSIASRSGAVLAGLYRTGDGERKGVIVCAHPLKRNAKGFFLRSGRAEALLRNGYDVLLFDFNGFGASSQGDFNYAHDILAVAEEARARAGGRPVHALAVCFGAVWTLDAATRAHPFHSIVVESPLTSLPDYYKSNRKAHAVARFLRRVFPKASAVATPIEAITRLSGKPRLLIIGGTADTITPLDMSRRLFDACTLPRSARALWLVDHARHLQAFEVNAQAYEERVVSFLAAALPPKFHAENLPAQASADDVPAQSLSAPLRTAWGIHNDQTLRMQWRERS